MPGWGGGGGAVVNCAGSEEVGPTSTSEGCRTSMYASLELSYRLQDHILGGYFSILFFVLFSRLSIAVQCTVGYQARTFFCAAVACPRRESPPRTRHSGLCLVDNYYCKHLIESCGRTSVAFDGEACFGGCGELKEGDALNFCFVFV